MGNTILLIEDSSPIVETMQAILEMEGYEVEVALNGRAGISALKRLGSSVRVILLDMMMPVMNGWGFLGFQRAHPEYAEIPVVVVSAFGEVARSAHANAFIPKPIKFDELLATVKRYCA